MSKETKARPKSGADDKPPADDRPPLSQREKFIQIADETGEALDEALRTMVGRGSGRRAGHARDS